MKKVVILLSLLLFGVNTFAVEYNFLVLPMNLVNNQTTDLININTEELFANKIINQIIMTNLALTPNIKTLKSTAKAQNDETDIESLMEYFNTKNAIIITSKVELQNSSDEKKFWSKLELPMITDNSNNLRVITKVELLKDNKKIWKNIYFKYISVSNNNLNKFSKHLSKTEIFNEYYEQLAVNVIKEIKDFDKNIFYSTHKINLEPEDKINESPKIIESNKQESKPTEKTFSEIDKIQNKESNTTLKPNLELKENVTPQVNIKFIDKIKESVSLKNDNIQQEIGEKNIRNKDSSDKNMYIISPKTTVKNLTPISENQQNQLQNLKWTDKIKLKYNNFIKKFKK